MIIIISANLKNYFNNLNKFKNLLKNDQQVFKRQRARLIQIIQVSSFLFNIFHIDKNLVKDLSHHILEKSTKYKIYSKFI